MTSAIATIYDNIAATTITVSGKTIAVKDADELPNSVAAANVPVRLLTPISSFGLEVGAVANVVGSSIGGNPFDVDWNIIDLMLWAKAISGVGLKAYGKDLIAYCAAWYEMVRALGATHNVIGARCTPDVINYPIGSDDWFYGVRGYLVIKEKF